MNEAFRLELRNRFEILEDFQEPESLWQGFRESVQDFGKKKLSGKRGRKKEWISDRTWTLIEERNILKKEMEQSQRTRQSTEKYKKKARQVKNGARKDKNKWFDKLANEAQEHADRGNMRELYRKMKQIAGKTSKKVTLPVRDKDGNLITDEKGQNERWKEHFEAILNRPSPRTVADIEDPETELPVSTEPFNLDEVRAAIRKMKNNKSPE